MKKRIIFIGIIVIALITIFIVWLLAPTPAPKSINDMVLNNEEDYTSTALIYYKDFQKQNTDMLRYSRVAFIDGTYEIYCYPELSDIYKIELNETEGISAMTLHDCRLLDDQPIAGVIVYDGFVSFCNEGGHESLVYSVDGTRPSYLHDPDEDFDRIWVHKITDNWYYIRGEQIYVNGHRIRGK